MSLIEKFECGDIVENRYHLDIKIHEGRWGDIYRGTDRLNDRPVAIRFFPITDTGPEDRERFEAHARELAGLTAPTLATPTDHGVYEEIPYLVFRWAPGQDLQDRLAERGALEFDQTLTILEKMLDGLQRAHDSRMTHGLIRPVKVIVDDLETDDPLVKIVDFQIWRFFEWTRGEDAFNEDHLSRRIVRYTSPEVLEDHRVKPSTDIYATGLLAIEFLTGQPAYDDNNRVALIGQQLSDEDPSLGADVTVSDKFRQFVRKLVAKDEQKRFRSAEQALTFFRDHRDDFHTDPEPDTSDRSDKSGAPDDSSDASDSSPPPKAGVTSPPAGMQESSSSEPETPDRQSDDSDSHTQVVSGPAAAAAADQAQTSDDGDSHTQVVSGPAATASADQEASPDSDVDPDEELFEGDPSSMRSLSDGESFADDSADDEPTSSDELLDEDEDDPLFDDEGDFGDFYDDEESASKDRQNDSSSGAEQPPSRPGTSPDRPSDSPDRPSSSPDQSRSNESPPGDDEAEDDELHFDESVAADIPEAQNDPDEDPWAGPDAPRDNRGPQNPPSSSADHHGTADSPARRSNRPAGQSRPSVPGSKADDSDITLPQAAALAVGMLALLTGAILYVTIGDDDPTNDDAAVAEAEEEQEEEIHVLEINTDPPAQRVQTSVGHSGMSPLEIEVPQSEFPLEIRARKNPETEAQRILEEPTDEIYFDFGDD